MLKSANEYRFNLYSYILTDIVILFSYMMLFSVVWKLVYDVVGWNLYDFWLFLMFTIVAIKLMYGFTIRKFGIVLLKGQFNTTQLQPINRYFNETTRNVQGQGLITTLISFVVLCISLVFVEYEMSVLSVFISFSILFFGILYLFSYINVFESLGFFFKNTETLVVLMNNRLNYVNEHFTPKIFEELRYGKFFYFLPSAIYGYFTVEALKGNYDLFFLLLPYFLLTFIFFIIATYLLWYYGLKKYEAFG